VEIPKPEASNANLKAGFNVMGGGARLQEKNAKAKHAFVRQKTHKAEQLRRQKDNRP
jgi:hypothetical protein